jgi:hypothetical protein
LQSTKPHPPTSHPLERFLAIVGAVVCLIITLRIWQVFSGQQPMWPLPGLYLVEMAGLSAIGMLCIIRDDPRGGSVAWIIVGVLLAFAVIGAWSIGPLFLPVALIFVLTAILSDRRRNRRIVFHLGLCVVAAIAQAALMLAAIRLLYPDAVF